MVNAWQAEQNIDSRTALALIIEQLPFLKPKTIKLLGVGWDNTAYLINEKLIFRFPRRQIAVPLLTKEFHVLSKLAEFLPLKIPLPQWFGQAGLDYPWPFLGYRMLEGKSACQFQLDAFSRSQLAVPLAQALASLHAIPLSQELQSHLPENFMDKLNVSRLTPLITSQLAELYSLGLFQHNRLLLNFLAQAQDLKPGKRLTLVHGDLYVRHLLLDNEQRLIGIIDWGDVHRACPAVDLSIAHSFLPPEAQSLFRKAYGDIEETVWQLARFRAIYHSSVLALYGYKTQDKDILREGLWALTQISQGL